MSDYQQQFIKLKEKLTETFTKEDNLIVHLRSEVPEFEEGKFSFPGHFYQWSANSLPSDNLTQFRGVAVILSGSYMVQPSL